MDHTSSMRDSERIRNLNPDLQRLVKRQSTFLDSVLERVAFQVFHDQEIDPILTAHVEDWADVRVTERSERFGLALESLFQARTCGNVLRENLNGDRPVQASIGGLVDFTHAACPDGELDFIRPETSAGTEGHLSMESMGIVAGLRDFANAYGLWRRNQAVLNFARNTAVRVPDRSLSLSNTTARPDHADYAVMGRAAVTPGALIKPRW
jgi:hypothetical protein